MLTKTKEMRVRGKLTLFCFSTLKLKYLAYLSLRPFVYDLVYYVKHHIPFERKVCHFLSVT